MHTRCHRLAHTILLWLFRRLIRITTWLFFACNEWLGTRRIQLRNSESAFHNIYKYLFTRAPNHSILIHFFYQIFSFISVEIHLTWFPLFLFLKNHFHSYYFSLSFFFLLKLTPTHFSSSTSNIFIPNFARHLLYSSHPQLRQFAWVEVQDIQERTRAETEV